MATKTTRPAKAAKAAKVPKPKRKPAGRRASAKATGSRAVAHPQTKSRLSPAERERQIIDGAIAYFSEAGISGQTRELSKRLGITQPLLYRYFPSKQALLDRVYSTVFEGRWNPAWASLIRDRSIPLRDRLIEFYRQYSEATYRPDWLRIYLHAGLSDPAFNQRYIQLIQRELLPVYAREVRHYCGLESADLPVSNEEIEFVWSLHGGMFYYAVRQHIYQLQMQVPFMEKVVPAVDNFLAGARTTYPALLADVAKAAKRPTPKGSGLARR